MPDETASDPGDANVLRKRFEALMNEALNQAHNANKCTKVPSAFREGFKWCLIVLGHIKVSTTELSDSQFQKLNDTMHSLLNDPPPPEA